ncbi:hypothetical protein ACLOJK_004203 [Asimina triloba]
MAKGRSIAKTSPYFGNPLPLLDETNDFHNANLQEMKKMRQKKRITSPYFPNPKPQPPKPKRITSPYFNNPKPKPVESKKIITSPYFNNPKPKPVESKKIITSPYFNNPKPSTTSPVQVEPKRITSPYFNNSNPKPSTSPVQVEPKRVTSPFFNNPKPSTTTTDPSSLKINNTTLPPHKSTTNSVDDDKDDGIKPPLPSSDHLLSIESFRYIPPSARRFPPVSPAIITAKAETDAAATAAVSTPIPTTVKPLRSISRCPCRRRRVCTFDEATEPTAAAALMSSSPPKKKRKRTSIVLSASQKRNEAYRRQSAGERTWEPPRSVHSLLQEDHAHDPWRVIAICMLLNCTTGHQVAFLAFFYMHCIFLSPTHATDAMPCLSTV